MALAAKALPILPIPKTLIRIKPDYVRRCATSSGIPWCRVYRNSTASWGSRDPGSVPKWGAPDTESGKSGLLIVIRHCVVGRKELRFVRRLVGVVH